MNSSISLSAKCLCRIIVFFIFPFLATGCKGAYSIIDPAGPSASIAAQLWWGMFAFFLLVGVVALWVYAMRRDPGPPPTRKEARRIQNRWIIGGGIILPVASIIIVLIFGIPAGHKMQTLSFAGQGEAVEIHVTARQWQWDVSYPGTDVLLVNEMHIPAGVPITLQLTTADVIHSFWVPRLGGKLDTIPGRENILRLMADQPGTYYGQCAEYCGLEHAHMKITVIAHDADGYTAWLEGMKNE